MDQITTRKCNRCGLEKPTSDLVASKRYTGGFMPLCKGCRNKYWKKHRDDNPDARRRHIETVLRSKMLRAYGMVAADYDRMVKDQGGRCKLCGSDSTGRNDRYRFWNIDHCHKTGRVRGLLCHFCNITLGKFEKLQDQVGLDAILAYLAEPGGDLNVSPDAQSQTAPTVRRSSRARA